MILDKINSPADVKKLSVNDMERLANEIREALFNRLTKIGRHFDACQSPVWKWLGQRTSGESEITPQSCHHVGRRHCGRRFRRKNCVVLWSVGYEGYQSWPRKEILRPLPQQLLESLGITAKKIVERVKFNWRKY